MASRVCLRYPFELGPLLRKRQQIKADLLAKAKDPLPLRVLLAGGSTTDELAWLVEIFLLNRGFSASIQQLDFNQYYNTAMSGCPRVSEFAPNAILLHTGLRNLPALPQVSDSPEQVEAKLTDCLNHLLDSAQGLYNQFGCQIILNNLAYPGYRLLGNLDGCHPTGLSNFVLRLNFELAKASLSKAYLVIQDIHYLSAQVGIDTFFDSERYHSFRIAESFSGSVHTAHNLSRLLAARFGRAKKVAVLDLDNTLWGGVIGDDGVEGIELGPDTPVGEAFLEFQGYLNSLRDRGVILAVASKNSPESAHSGLSHPYSLLRPDKFASIQAHWDRKDLSLQSIAEELSLGSDSFVFVDDNPAERALIQESLPQVSVISASEPVSMKRILDREGDFEPATITQEDLARSDLYAAERLRENTHRQYADYNDYLASLAMVANIQPCRQQSSSRFAQLINKTNQFNLTTIRLSETDFQQRLSSGATYLCLEGSLRDRFGSHGLVSAIIGQIDRQNLHLTHWVMSCRVLKRGLETAMFEKLISLCRAKSIRYVWGYYRRSSKNTMVENLFRELGFEVCPPDPSAPLQADEVFRLDLNQIKSLPEHFIRSENYEYLSEDPGHLERSPEPSRT